MKHISKISHEAYGRISMYTVRSFLKKETNFMESGRTEMSTSPTKLFSASASPFSGGDSLEKSSNPAKELLYKGERF